MDKVDAPSFQWNLEHERIFECFSIFHLQIPKRWVEVYCAKRHFVHNMIYSCACVCHYCDIFVIYMILFVLTCWMRNREQMEYQARMLLLTVNCLWIRCLLNSTLFSFNLEIIVDALVYSAIFFKINSIPFPFVHLSST